MALSSESSLIVSLILVVLLFSGVQVNRQWFAASPARTLFGGFVSSLIFMFSLTSIGNLEAVVFGKGFQTKIIPEVLACFIFMLFTAATIHRVCVTTGFICSCVALYYMVNISHDVYATQPKIQPIVPPRKKKH